MEDVAGVLSKDERLTLLRFLKKLGKHARIFLRSLSIDWSDKARAV
jgi:hypothetical protein